MKVKNKVLIVTYSLVIFVELYILYIILKLLSFIEAIFIIIIILTLSGALVGIFKIIREESEYNIEEHT